MAHAQSSGGKALRLGLLGFLLAVMGYLLAPDIKYYGERAYMSVKDRFDKRPIRYVLFIGNSRTYYHNMPMMVRYMADSANSPYRYVITQQTPSGKGFKDHWNNATVQDLLKRKWDEVVIQSQSSANLIPPWSDSFMEYGAKLVNLATDYGNRPRLYTSWVYEGQEYARMTASLAGWYKESAAYYARQRIIFYPFDRDIHYARIQTDHKQLAQTTGADMVNIGEVWERLRNSDARFQSLTTDGNHPTLQGSYLVALMFYATFSEESVDKVTYRPPGITVEDAQAIKQVVTGYIDAQSSVQ